MKRLPLYEDQRAPVEQATAAANDPDCRRCRLGGRGSFTCLKPEGPSGGALLLFTKPSKTGRPAKVAGQVLAHAREHGRAAIDHAIRCGGTSADAVEACRPLTAGTLAAGYERIICLGSAAAHSVLGESAPTYNTRRCWTSLADGTPVFLLPDPEHVRKNRVRWQWLREDLQWAMTAAVVPRRGAELRLVETVEDALEAVADLARVGYFFDTETYGRMYDRDFKVAAFAGAPLDEPERVWVWPGEACLPGDPRCEALKGLEGVDAWAHNGEFDVRAMRHGPRVEVQLAGDTLVHAKLIAPHGSGGLASLAWKVGLGGHKGEMESCLARARRVLKLLRREAAKEVAEEWTTERRTINTKKGPKHQQRKIPAKTRPPTREEAEAQARACWGKPRSIDKVKRSPAEYMGVEPPALGDPPLSDDWLNAAIERAEVAEDTYVYGLADESVRLRYVARDVFAGALLVQLLTRIMATSRHAPQQALLDSHLQALPAAVAKIEDEGMPVDMGRLRKLEAFLDAKLREVTAKIEERAPGLDVGSDDQVRALLFGPPSKGGMGLEVIEKTKKDKKPSVKGEVLQQLAVVDPWVNLIISHRELAKLQSNYARGMRRFIQDDGRVHCHFNITGAESGRFSCHDPNMQTIPSRGQYAYKVKELFVAPPGYKIVQLDYGTLELRIAAMLSKDEVMLDAFRRGLDLHRRTAELCSPMLWGSPLDDCEPGEQKRRRGVCKTVNFGTVYGQHATTLAFNAGISVKEAEAAQRIVMGNYRGLSGWIEDTSRRAVRTGVTWTWWAGQRARCRAVPDVGSSWRGDVAHGKRQAYNTPVQGTGAEFCHASLAHLVPLLEEEGLDARLCLTVHDSLVFICADDDVAELVYQARRIMTQWDAGGVPLVVDAEVGQDWGNLEKVAA